MKPRLLEPRTPEHTVWMPPRQQSGPPHTTTELPVRVRFRARRDLDPLVDLLKRALPPGRFAMEVRGSEWALRSHLDRFPEGQWVAERADGRMIGAAMCLRVGLDQAMSPHTREEMAQAGGLGLHDGNALYGMALAVEPAYQHQGIGKFLVQVQVEMGRLLGCRAFFWGGRLAGYYARTDLRPHDYLDRVREGRLWDPALGPMLAMGFQALGLLERYAADPETLGYGALLYRPL